MSQSVPLHNQSLSSMLALEYPQPIGVFSSYDEAQKAIDYLADQEFPVKNIALVGTDLRLLERVTGRRTWGTALWGGVQSGISTGLLIALLMFFMNPGADFFSMLLVATGVGIVIGIVIQLIAYAVGRGKRDFTSISQTVATNYELLCEHKVAGQARDLLAKRPGARAAQFDPRYSQPYPGQPPVPGGPYPAPHPGQQPVGYPQPGPYADSSWGQQQPPAPQQSPTPQPSAPQYPAPQYPGPQQPQEFDPRDPSRTEDGHPRDEAPHDEDPRGDRTADA